jgi:ribosome recycling factor
MSYDYSDLNARMDKTIETFRKELGSLRTGRASAGLLDQIRIDFYGTLSPLNQVATISIPESRTLSVQVWDKSMVKKVEKAILDSDLGLNPTVDGDSMRIHLPELNEERRRELTKIAAKYAEAARIAIRNVRRDEIDEIKKLEKDSEISKDEVHTFTQGVQKHTDEHIKKIDELLSAKEKDIMTL